MKEEDKAKILVREMKAHEELLKKAKDRIRKVLRRQGLIPRFAKIHSKIKNTKEGQELMYNYYFDIPPFRKKWGKKIKNNTLGEDIQIVIKPDSDRKFRIMRMILEVGQGKVSMKDKNEDKIHPHWETYQILKREIKDIIDDITELLEKVAPEFKQHRWEFA